ncbi:MnmC family methyltransferase [Halobacteriovorax sp. HLS]|uniref:MnmC family methyltransferase n=1 Tax=Halobacteriovorax sp. HLS TaxID=2234000 RepID=UPI000FDA4D30|nr:MnmC family methyltransferase [Halobacteriovorax sp. HLS]
MKDFDGKLGSYKLVETEDSSFTLYSSYFDENCHSTSGAVEETEYNYILGCEILSQSKIANPFTIFEVGLGLGLGPKLSYENLESQNVEIKFISTEIDEGLIHWVSDNIDCPIFKNLEKIKLNDLTYYYSKNNNFEFYILLGDARQTTPLAAKEGLLKDVLSIFQDPFSHKKNPTLWTCEWFSLLKEVAHDSVIMATYSGHISVRKSMFHAGWKVFKRDGFGVKRSMTIAKLHGQMNQDIERNITTAPDELLRD